MAVIHYFHLVHLLRELSPGSTVRVEAAARRLPAAPSLARVAFEVYVRAETHRGELLSWMLRTAESEVAAAEPDDSIWDGLFAANEAEAERVRQFVVEEGFNVQRGLLDLGGTQPVSGVWRESDFRVWVDA
jgi:hypothetical protein